MNSIGKKSEKFRLEIKNMTVSGAGEGLCGAERAGSGVHHLGLLIEQ